MTKVLCPSQSEELMKTLDAIELDIKTAMTICNKPRVKKSGNAVLKEIEHLRSEYGLGVMDSG